MRTVGFVLGAIVNVAVILGCDTNSAVSSKRTPDSGLAGSGGMGSGGTAGSGKAGVAGSSRAPEVRFIGRPDRRQAGVVQLAWSGSAIVFRFQGTGAAVRLDDRAQFFTVIVDGRQAPDLATTNGEKLYPVASGLTDGEHEVRLYRRAEASFGVTRFLGVELGGGKLLAPPRAAARRIEVIGDSITCGYGNEGADMNCPFSADTENHYLTYAAIAARNLDAELVTVAWSGKGIVYNYGEDTVDPLPALYDRALPEQPASSWDFSLWQPDVVVINLGTNDFSTEGDPSEAIFVAAYRAFLLRVRRNYPKAWIICLVPSLLEGAEFTVVQGYLTRLVNELSSQGDSRIKVHALSFQTTGAGCDWHPSLKTHAAMGEALTRELKTVLAW